MNRDCKESYCEQCGASIRQRHFSIYRLRERGYPEWKRE